MGASPTPNASGSPAPLSAEQLDKALRHAQQVVRGSRVCRPEHAMLASVLLKLRRVPEAEEVIREALTLETGPADAYDGLAFISMLVGQHERSNQLYRRAAELGSGDPRFWYNLACSERSFGRLNEAEAACDRAIAL